jgi:short subunit dehydrogenase-like uncharacterized protein
MAPVMANCVRRSNAVNNYSPSLVYGEEQVYPSFMAGVVTFISGLLLVLAIFLPPLKWVLLATKLLPNPGEGPSEASMDDGFLKVFGVGQGSKGTEAKITLYFPTDPGYRDTARMLVESGLALALDLDKIQTGGGVWTPATCQVGSHWLFCCPNLISDCLHTMFRALYCWTDFLPLAAPCMWSKEEPQVIELSIYF